jgi:hypothetical protein
MSRQRPSLDCIAQGSDCSGAGSHDQDGHGYHRNCAHSSGKWRETILAGEERIANELLLKLGIQISPRTVRKYMPKRPPGQPRGDQRWSTFVSNHAQAIVACDFLTVVTATFKCIHVFVIIELGTRRLLHIRVTDHPTASWTQLQLREAISSDHSHRFLIHDRDCIIRLVSYSVLDDYCVNKR